MTSKLENNTIESASLSLDHVLSILEEIWDLYEQLREKIWENYAQMLTQVIRFWTLSQEAYTFLTSQKKWYFRKLIASLNYKNIENELGIFFSKEARNGLWITFEIELTQTLISYEIFYYIQTGTLNQKYEELWKWDDTVVYQERETWHLYLKVWNQYYMEDCIVKEHFKMRDRYLYFDAGESLYVFDIQNNKILELEWEYEFIATIREKNYLVLHIPNKLNPKENNLYCIEDETEISSNIKGNAWFILEVFWFWDQLCMIKSDVEEYEWYSKWQKAIKLWNTTKLEIIWEKGLFVEQEWVFRNVKVFWEEICLITEKMSVYLDETWMFRNNSVFIIEYYNRDWYNLENWMRFPKDYIKNMEISAQDIVLCLELEKDRFDIYSLAAKIAQSHSCPVPISQINRVEKDQYWVIIHFTYITGHTWIFPSLDYPSHHRH